jgi:hypothetical protein
MSKLLLSLFVLAYLVSCQQTEKKDDSLSLSSESDTLTMPNYLSVEGDSVVVRPFEIRLDLTVRADTKIIADKETLMVSVTLTGAPKDTTRVYRTNGGEIGLVSREVELQDTRIARFDNLRFPKSAYNSLAEKDIRLLVNVYNGRKASKDNILNCDLLSENMSTLQDHQLTIQCRLIEENQ